MRRIDESSDAIFYSQPRFVVHIDEGAIGAVRALYSELIGPADKVLDLMSSWRSHLPEPMRATGLGLNSVEMDENPQLEAWVVHELNAGADLPFADAAFDAVVCCVSVQYLVRPVQVFASVARILRPGGVFVVTFSNRCFATKAVQAWLDGDDAAHSRLVEGWMLSTGCFGRITSQDRSPPCGDPLWAVWGYTTPPPAPARGRERLSYS